MFYNKCFNHGIFSPLCRHKFLTCLPGIIDTNIKAGNYNAVINDVSRAMPLYDDAAESVPVLSKYKQEVCVCVL